MDYLSHLVNFAIHNQRLMSEIIQECQCQYCKEKSAPVSTLSAEELTYLCNNSVVLLFKGGEKIIKQGTFTQNIIFIKSGIIKLHMTGPLKRDEILQIDKGPRFIGIPDAFANKIHCLSVTALTETKACFIDFAGFTRLVRNNSDFAHELIKTLSHNIIGHYERCVNKVQKQLTAMMAEALLYFSGHLFESDEFMVPLTRSEFGEYIGTTRESVTKIIHDFTKDGIIEVNGKNIRIRNRDILEKISNIG